MRPVLISDAAQSLGTIAGTKKSSIAQNPQKEPQEDKRIKAVKDEYVPEEEHVPTGIYQVGKDEDGNPKVYFDDPESVNDAPNAKGENPEEENPEVDGEKKRASDKKAETCRGNTDKVDREIKKLKEKKKELEQRVRTESDEVRLKEWKKELASVERELKQKDNDAYRRQHSTFY